MNNTRSQIVRQTAPGRKRTVTGGLKFSRPARNRETNIDVTRTAYGPSQTHVLANEQRRSPRESLEVSPPERKNRTNARRQSENAAADASRTYRNAQFDQSLHRISLRPLTTTLVS